MDLQIARELAADPVNVQLLAELQRDPRISMSALGRAIGLSAPATSERFRRLREAGVITGFGVEIDPRALGFPVAAWVRVRPGPGMLPKIAALAQETPEVTECHRITGDDCFLLKVYARGVTEFEEVLDRILLYGQTASSIIQSSPVPPRPAPLPGQPPSDRQESRFRPPFRRRELPRSGRRGGGSGASG
jgi:Lrp/AsnC family transcriptional regulator, leucine-responsive regulatory protein